MGFFVCWLVFPHWPPPSHTCPPSQGLHHTIYNCCINYLNRFLNYFLRFSFSSTQVLSYNTHCDYFLNTFTSFFLRHRVIVTSAVSPFSTHTLQSPTLRFLKVEHDAPKGWEDALKHSWSRGPGNVDISDASMTKSSFTLVTQQLPQQSWANPQEELEKFLQRALCIKLGGEKRPRHCFLSSFHYWVSFFFSRLYFLGSRETVPEG